MRKGKMRSLQTLFGFLTRKKNRVNPSAGQDQKAREGGKITSKNGKRESSRKMGGKARNKAEVVTKENQERSCARDERREWVPLPQAKKDGLARSIDQIESGKDKASISHKKRKRDKI